MIIPKLYDTAYIHKSANILLLKKCARSIKVVSPSAPFHFVRLTEFRGCNCTAFGSQSTIITLVSSLLIQDKSWMLYKSKIHVINQI